MSFASSDKIGRGLISPLKRGSSDFESGTGRTLVESNIRQAVGVRSASPDDSFLGEYPHRPEFGSLVYRFRHANIRYIAGTLAIVYAARAVSTWEPRAYVDTQNTVIQPGTGTTIEGMRSSQIKIRYGLEDDVAGSIVDRTEAGAVEVEIVS